jgi:hypothetical protein
MENEWNVCCALPSSSSSIPSVAGAGVVVCAGAGVGSFKQSMSACSEPALRVKAKDRCCGDQCEEFVVEEEKKEEEEEEEEGEEGEEGWVAMYEGSRSRSGENSRRGTVALCW